MKWWIGSLCLGSILIKFCTQNVTRLLVFGSSFFGSWFWISPNRHCGYFGGKELFSFRAEKTELVSFDCSCDFCASDMCYGLVTLLKKRLQRSCFPVKFANFLRTPCVFLSCLACRMFSSGLWSKLL